MFWCCCFLVMAYLFLRKRLWCVFHHSLNLRPVFPNNISFAFYFKIFPFKHLCCWGQYTIIYTADRTGYRNFEYTKPGISYLKNRQNMPPILERIQAYLFYSTLLVKMCSTRINSTPTFRYFISENRQNMPTIYCN